MKLNILFSFLLIPAFVSCGNLSSEKPIEDLPLVNIENDRHYSAYCLYIIDESARIDTSRVSNLVFEKLAHYALVDSISDLEENYEFAVDLFNDPLNTIPPPDIESLSYFGYLTDEEINLIQTPNQAILITFSGNKEKVIEDQLNMNYVIDALIKNGKVLVTDYVTYETFNKDTWSSRRMDGFNDQDKDITGQITIHSYREENQYCRAVTLGMSKFCLPEVSISNFACTNQNSYASLINLICQTWIENPEMRNDSTLIVSIEDIKNERVKTLLTSSLEQNAKGKALISLKSVTPQMGDVPSAQFEVSFENDAYSSPQEEQEALIGSLFGSTDEIDYVKHNDRLLEASERAKEKIPDLKNRFSAGLGPGYAILLKAPFDTDSGGIEWMWVEVTEWSGEIVEGILQNDPYEIADLKAGAIVSFNQNDVFDYILYLPDGSFEGNETGKIISEGK